MKKRLRDLLCWLGWHSWREIDVMNGPLCFECRHCPAYKEEWPLGRRL